VLLKKQSLDYPQKLLSSGDQGMGEIQKPTRPPLSNTTLRLVLLSDTHQLHREVDVPNGDILIHAGDFTLFSESMESVADFNDWLGQLPHRHKIVVPGNHESFLEEDPSQRSLLDNATVLIDEGTEVEGLRIWGSPITPLYGVAFGLSSAKDRKRAYARIPDGIDVLISHGPPFGILDTDPVSGSHEGCRELLEAVTQRIRPKLHVFGHIHAAYGIFGTEPTTFVNASRLGLGGHSREGPFVFEISRR
jgi:Icc-related predicted phosphoesterase